MKINLTRLPNYYHRFTCGLIYFSAKYLNESNVLLFLTILSFLLSSALFMFSVFNYFEVINTHVETMKYLEQFDFPLELIEHNGDRGDKTVNQCNNIILKFLNLFNNNNNSIAVSVLPEELRNHYYIHNKFSDDICVSSAGFNANESNVGIINYDKYFYRTSFTEKVLLQLETLCYVLNDLKSINDNIASRINSM